MGKTLAAWLLVATAAASPAVAPRDVVQSAVSRVVIALQKTDSETDASPTRRLSAEQRRTEIRRVATDLFDFDEISRRALSRYWTTRTAEEQAEFTRLFTDLLERAYIGRIESYAGEKIVYPAEKIDGDFAIVRSRIVPKRRTADARVQETGLEYRMLKKDGRWKVYDVIIDGVSFVSTYRSQFDRIIKASSYQMLVDRLRGPEKVGTTERP